MHEHDGFKTNSTNAHFDSKVGENGRSEKVEFEDTVEKDSVDEVITNKVDMIDENNVVAEYTENETNQDYLENICKYDAFSGNVPNPVQSTAFITTFGMKTSHPSLEPSLPALSLLQYPRISTLP